MDYLHNHPEFKNLLRILADKTGIEEGLIEKDYWLMHTLYGLRKQGYEFVLKGGTSLSKGFNIIDRFSEDIDLYIKPRAELQVDENPKHTKERQVETRKQYYDLLAEEIAIDGIITKVRDTAFDDLSYYRNGGIRLKYDSKAPAVDGAKEGILLEAGFSMVTPNKPCTISSWAYERAIATSGIAIKDNRAIDIPCYLPGYTFVEKLQTVTSKFRVEQESGKEGQNFMRQYYDVSSLLKNPEVDKFIGTDEYHAHKERWFSTKDKETPIKENEAFRLSDPKLRKRFKTRYQSTQKLYYNGQPDFEELLSVIEENLDRL